MSVKQTRYSDEALARARRTWGEWCTAQGLSGALHEAATNAAVAYLQLGLSASAVAALVRLRLDRRSTADTLTVREEDAYLKRALADAAQLVATGVITDEVGKYLEREYRARGAALDEWQHSLAGEAVAPATAVVAAPIVAPPPPARTAPAKPPPPGAPPPPAFSLRDLFAEHSVLLLAALGAFLLVVATVLFELYGTTGLGGGVRLAAVVVLNIVFAFAGYFARRRKGLESVGQIYIALAAVLLPLVGVAAWTFLALGERGITVYQAAAVTAAACAVAYGTLARRLDLRAYGAMAGIAIFAAVTGISGWIGGDYWVAAGIAVTPLLYAAWQRALPSNVFRDFQWFAHASAVVALGLAVRYEPTGWLWTAVLAGLAIAYLGWQALAQQPLRAWIGEGAAIAAAAAASGPLGVSNGHFLLPMAVAVPLIALQREPDLLGMAGRLYKPHIAHLHAAVVLGVALALWEHNLGESWTAVAAFWFAFALYAADYYLGPSVLTGATIRVALPLALAASVQPLGIERWASAVVAVTLVAYVAPFAIDRLQPMRRFASWFFYAALLFVGLALIGSRVEIGAGHWEIVVALVISAVGFGAAAEYGEVRLSAIAARGLFSVAWFIGVDALNAQGWRGPFDALLALFYVALGQAQALARHTVANAARRWFVHAAALLALALCFTGPDDLLWWRFTAAFGTLTVAYWWLALGRKEAELPWVAWTALAAGVASFVMAAIPDTWQGSTMSGAALALTGAWLAARRTLDRRRLESSAVIVLLGLSVAGVVLTFRALLPAWDQAVALILLGAFFLAWSLIGDAAPLLMWRAPERAAASFFASTGLLIAGGMLAIDSGVAGVVLIAIASAHAEWSLRAKDDIERWYAMAAMLVSAPVLYFWPYAHEPAAVVAFEFAALSVLVARTAVRGGHWWLPYASVILLAPVLRIGFVAAGAGDQTELEEIAFAALAGLAGLAGLGLRTRFPRRWAWSVHAGAVTIALATLTVMAVDDRPDAAGIALLAYAALIYTAALQEKSRWVVPFAAGSALAGSITLLNHHHADTILYAALLGVLGLTFWVLGRGVFVWLGKHPVVEMHRYLGLGLLVLSAIAGFNFPDRTGAGSLGAILATAALLITGAVLWLDEREYLFRPAVYLAIVAACSGAFFAVRYLGLSSWELVGPGVGLIAAGIRLRTEHRFKVDVWIRRLLVGGGLALAMGWAAVLTVEGDLWWLVALLIEGAITVGVGVALRSRVLLAGGGAALALASLRALLLIAEAGYLFIAFGAVALVLIAVATALALGRERYLSGTRGMREQLATWD